MIHREKNRVLCVCVFSSSVCSFKVCLFVCVCLTLADVILSLPPRRVTVVSQLTQKREKDSERKGGNRGEKHHTLIVYSHRFIETDS